MSKVEALELIAINIKRTAGTITPGALFIVLEAEVVSRVQDFGSGC